MTVLTNSSSVPQLNRCLGLIQVTTQAIAVVELNHNRCDQHSPGLSQFREQ
ncbi:hypothetical protein NON20_05245 [Synechocystis sp. B12]|nr:hypothetical protein NON20_05245 [Synechocystis sp. B12]